MTDAKKWVQAMQEFAKAHEAVDVVLTCRKCGLEMKFPNSSPVVRDEVTLLAVSGLLECDCGHKNSTSVSAVPSETKEVDTRTVPEIIEGLEKDMGAALVKGDHSTANMFRQQINTLNIINGLPDPREEPV